MRRKRKLRSGFTLVELLVVIAIVGVLIGMLLPAVQGVREAARRTDCLNNLKQIGLATVSFHDAHGAFPPARVADSNQVLPLFAVHGPESWCVRILPFIEQQPLFDQWDLTVEYAMQVEEAGNTPVSTLLCASRHTVDSAFADVTVPGFDLGCG